MARPTPRWLFYTLISPFLFRTCLSLVFKDIPPSELFPGSYQTRDSVDDPDFRLLNILKGDSFFWTGVQNGQYSLANFTVDLSGEDESIVSMEKFQYMLNSVECTPDTMSLGFKGDPAYDYIKSAWQWVNDADSRKLVVVASPGACSSNTTRLPFSTASIVFNDATNTAKLVGKPISWKDFHNYELTVSRYQPASDSAKRDLDKSWSLDFNHDIPFNTFKIPVSPELDVTLDCVDCRTTGSFDFGLHIKTSRGIPQEAFISLQPNGVGVDIAPRIRIRGNLTKGISDEKKLASIPLDPISISGDVLEISPEITFSVGWALGPVSGDAYVSSGVDVSIPDSAELEFQLTSPNVSASGWEPSVQTIPISLDAKLTAKLNIYLKTELGLNTEVLGQAFEVGVDIKPYVGGTFSLEESSDGVCAGNSDIFGVEVTPALGVSVNADVSAASDPEHPLVSTEIVNFAAPLPTACFPFGPDSLPSGPSLSLSVPAAPFPSNPHIPTSTY